MGIVQRIKSGWNAFLGRYPTQEIRNDGANNQPYMGYSSRPDRMHFVNTSQRTIVASVYNRIAIDVSSIRFEHCKVDENGSFVENIDSGLNYCLNTEANTDQTGKALLQDIVQSMFDEGCVAVVPTDTDFDPTRLSEQWMIQRLKVGRIVGWYPSEVVVHLYNERTGNYQDLRLPKSSVAVIENPFYSIMNEPNSTLKRLQRTIAKLDQLNEQSAAGKLDLIIQLPYAVKSEQRKEIANQRRKELTEQLEGSRYGVAWADGTERIIQLNRSLENNLWDQVKDLTTQLYNQLGLTQGVMDGSANEAVMINYYNNTIAPICSVICDEFKRKFLSRTARSQGQSIVFFRDPFKLVPVSQLADIADKFRRNEIMTSNEIRAEIGLKPSDAQQAETLSNPNITQSSATVEEGMGEEGDAQNDDANDSGGDDYVQDILDELNGGGYDDEET